MLSYGASHFPPPDPELDSPASVNELAPINVMETITGTIVQRKNFFFILYFFVKERINNCKVIKAKLPYLYPKV